jgi:hypothetical protein
VENESIRGGWEKPAWDLNLNGTVLYRQVMETAALVPVEASVAASRGLIPYVSNRAGITQSIEGAEYVLLDTKNVDETMSADWAVAQRNHRYELVAQRGRFELRRRLPDSPQ